MKKIFNLPVLTDIGLLAFEGFWIYKSFELRANSFNDALVWGDMATFPLFMLYILVALTVIDLIKTIVKIAKEGLPEKSAAEKKGGWYAVITIVMLVIYAFVLEYIGFVIATILLLVGVMLLCGCRKWYLLVGVPVVTSFALYALFRFALTILLPTIILP